MPFNIGPMELVIVLVLALVVFGPSKLPEIGGAVGKSIGEFRRATKDIEKEIREPINDIRQPFTDLKSAVSLEGPARKEPAAASPDVAPELTQTCPQCGDANPETSKFCGSCGAVLAVQAEVVTESE
ncbi:MAG: twin-arginine translocase TatA/TatE family subunit [Chloroflexota bacterium]